MDLYGSQIAWTVDHDDVAYTKAVSNYVESYTLIAANQVVGQEFTLTSPKDRAAITSLAIDYKVRHNATAMFYFYICIYNYTDTNYLTRLSLANPNQTYEDSAIDISTFDNWYITDIKHPSNVVT